MEMCTRRRHPRFRHVVWSGAIVVGFAVLIVPTGSVQARSVQARSVHAGSVHAEAGNRSSVGTVAKNSEDRIAMPRRNLSPTVTARRALGATFVDRVNVAFDVRLGTQTIGRLTGLVDLATGGADLRFLAPDNDGAIRKEPFTVRVRGERIQISLPNDLRGEAGVDGYVTTIREGTYGGVGVADEILIPVALLTALPLPLSVSSWNLPKSKASPSTVPPTTAKGAKTPTSVPISAAPTSLRGVATRTDFKVLSQDRFGETADVELALRPEGKLREITIRFTPLKTPEAKGLKPISLVGTVTRSTKVLAEAAPKGTFLTASKFFDLDPLPEDVDVPSGPLAGIETEADADAA